MRVPGGRTPGATRREANCWGDPDIPGEGRGSGERSGERSGGTEGSELRDVLG